MKVLLSCYPDDVCYSFKTHCLHFKMLFLNERKNILWKNYSRKFFDFFSIFGNLIFAISMAFQNFREDLFSRIALKWNFREDLILRKWQKFAKPAKINPLKVVLNGPGCPIRKYFANRGLVPLFLNF